jgi:hypothetical protein
VHLKVVQEAAGRVISEVFLEKADDLIHDRLRFIHSRFLAVDGCYLARCCVGIDRACIRGLRGDSRKGERAFKQEQRQQHRSERYLLKP